MLNPSVSLNEMAENNKQRRRLIALIKSLGGGGGRGVFHSPSPLLKPTFVTFVDMWDDNFSFVLFVYYFLQVWSTPESIATLPPFGPIEGYKWFDQISSQWESQKNRFAFISFGKKQFLLPCIWNLPFMSTASEHNMQHPIWVKFKTYVVFTPNTK